MEVVVLLFEARDFWITADWSASLRLVKTIWIWPMTRAPMCVKVNYHSIRRKKKLSQCTGNRSSCDREPFFSMAGRKKKLSKKIVSTSKFCSRSISRNRKFCFPLTFGSTFTFILCVHSTPRGGLDARVWLANSYNSSNVLLSCVSIE